MEVISNLRSSFRSRHAGTTNHSTGSLHSTEDNNNNSSSSSSGGAVHRKRTRTNCDLCGKRLLKLVKWRNYLTLPCRCRHVFCKQCITERLQCRQKVLRSASFDLMWTFPCPGSHQCGQELTVDWSRGSSYSRNLVARDLGTGDDSWTDTLLEEEEEESVCDITIDHSDVSDISSGCADHNISVLREIG